MKHNYDNRPIGVFDSGLGGLTAVTSLASLLPDERIVYFGDTARTPYGSKTIETIQRFSVQIAEFLLKHDVKVIVIACNTVSATCLEVLAQHFPGVPIIGIIEPAARKAAERFHDGQRIGVIGTKVTIKSRQYEKMILAHNENCKVYSLACPLLVPAIEEGLEDTLLMEQIVRYYMDSFVRENQLDVLVLGCTHYPLVEKTIRKLYPDLEIINPSETVAQEIPEILQRLEIRAWNNQNENRFYASDLSESFLRMTKNITAGSNVIIRQKNFEEEI